MTIRGRPLVVAWGALFIVSTTFPVVASLVQGSVSRRTGIADVVIAAVLVGHGFLIAAKGLGSNDAFVLEVSVRVLRGAANLFLALIVVFFVAGEHVTWGILLPGLAWRAWLFVWVLPGAIGLWSSAH